MSRSTRVWLGYWRLMARYHRYEVTGLEHLLGGSAALICGYHGRPLAHDLCMLTVRLHDELGYLPHGVIHGAFDKNPTLKRFIDSLGFVTGDSGEMSAAIARGEHIIVAPGGTREGCRSFRDRHRVSWGPRTGYVRLAVKYGLPVVPVACSGTDWTYVGLNNGYSLGKAVGMPARLPLWFGLGPLGLWPASPPFPVKLRQNVGTPIHLAALGLTDPNDTAGLEAAHQHITSRVQALLDREAT